MLGVPNLPPLSLDDGRHVGRGLLHVLRHPLAVGQFCLERLQLLERPELWP